MEDGEEQSEATRPPLNPPDRPMVTLDHNAIIALQKGEPAAPAVNDLLALNRAGFITLNVTQSTALENGRPGAPRDMQVFEAWLLSLGITRDHIFSSWRSVPFSTPDDPDAMTFDPQLDVALMRRIHEINFPDISFSWPEYRDRECERRDKSEQERQALAEWGDLRYFSGSPSLRPATPLSLTVFKAHQ